MGVRRFYIFFNVKSHPRLDRLTRSFRRLPPPTTMFRDREVTAVTSSMPPGDVQRRTLKTGT